MTKIRNQEKQKFLKKIGDNIKVLRKCHDLSQFQLAIEAEIPKNQVGRIERGEINTSIFTLKRIADALNIQIVEIFNYDS